MRGRTPRPRRSPASLCERQKTKLVRVHAHVSPVHVANQALSAFERLNRRALAEGAPLVEHGLVGIRAASKKDVAAARLTGRRSVFTPRRSDDGLLQARLRVRTHAEGLDPERARVVIGREGRTRALP